MKLVPLLLALCLPIASSAQTAAFTDPANLRGERVSPSDGRELPIDTGARGLQQLLRKLNTRASIMNIVAHPDDEDGGMLTLYSRGLGARVADISLTRGEGGQNAVTGDFEDALGLLRTQELLANDRYTGVDQFFGTEVDFGFSKTMEESFAKWGHDRVLYDVVRAIRLYRPLVLTSTWIGGVTDGHGQHQVSGQIAQEAFLAAGDPKVFPELTAEGILPWQPLKVYARVPMQSITPQGLFDYATGQYTPAKFTNYVTGEVTTTEPTVDIVVHEGTTDPLLSEPGEPARSYVQFARLGLSQQKSQMGPGMRTAPSGAFDVAYHLYGSRVQAPTARHITAQAAGLGEANQNTPRAEGPTQESATIADPSFFDGIDTSIAGIATLAPDAPKFLPESLAMLGAQIGQTTGSFNPAQPAASAPLLAECLQSLDRLIARLQAADFDPTQRESVLHELRVKRVQINAALTLALGLTFDATTHGVDQVAGSSIHVWTILRNASPSSLSIKRIHLFSNVGEVGDRIPGQPARSDGDSSAPDLTAEHADQRTLTATYAFTLFVTRPYFFRDDVESPVYQLKTPALRNAPASAPALTAWATVNYRGLDIELGRVVHDGPQAISIVPPVNLSLSARAQVLLRYREPGFTVIATSRVTTDQKLAPSVHLETPRGWVVKHSALLPDGRTDFLVVPPEARALPSEQITAAVTLDGIAYTEGFRPISYGDLPRTNYFVPATDRIVPIDLKLLNPAHERIAYLPGTGDAVPEAMASISLTPTLITVADLTPAKLSAFDSVVLGVRTYAAHPELHGAPTQALLDYARSGGNVVVQYQTGEFTAADAPYPLTLAPNVPQGTVVDETAPVQLLIAQSSKLAAQQGPPDMDDGYSLLTTPNRITPADFDGWIEERGHGFLRTWDDHYTALTETYDPGQAPQRGGLITTPLGKGRWTYCAFALYRQFPEAVPGAYRLFVNLLNP